MAVARSGTATTSSSATARGAITVTLDKTYNVGDTLVVLFSCRGSNTVTVTSSGSTWTSATGGTASNSASQLAYSILGASTSQITITPNASVIWMGAIIGFTGVLSINASAAPLSAVATNPAQSPALTPVATGYGLVGGVSCGINGTTLTSMATVQGGLTWTQEMNANDGGTVSSFQIQAMASAIVNNANTTHQIGWTKSTASNSNVGVGLILVPPATPSARKPVIKRQAVTTAATR